MSAGRLIPSFCARDAIPPSPCWHRRLRQKRSAARRRLRLGRGRLRDVVLLQSHHATPVTQAPVLAALSLRMGKQGRNSWQADGQAPWQQGQVQEHSLAALNTFPQCHSGPSHTWVSAKGSVRRLDYVCAPLDWVAACSTRTLPGFELMQARDDHYPLLATLCLRKSVQEGAYQPPPRRTAMRPDVQRDPLQAERVAASLACPTPIAWEVGVEQHSAVWADAHKQAWRLASSEPLAQARQSYLTPATLDLVMERRAFRQYAAVETKERRRRLLLVGFAAFLHHRWGTCFTVSGLTAVVRWFAEVDISIARAVRAIQLSSARVRQAVRQDRLAYLHGLQQQLAERDLKDARALYQALRHAFPQARSSRRSGFQPLPQVQMPSGDFAATREQRLCCWGEFFADQEAGYPVTGSQYQAELSRAEKPRCCTCVPRGRVCLGHHAEPC